jgi:uncharacterized membrane protein
MQHSTEKGTHIAQCLVWGVSDSGTRIVWSRMNRDIFFRSSLVFDVAGLLVSAYLTYLSFTPPTSCPIGSYGIYSCDEVIWSRYSHFYGVSVALLGFGWFVIASVLLALAWRDQRFMRGVLAWSLLGAAGVSAFVYTEVFLLGAICPLCTVAHIAGLAILVLSMLALRSRHSTR